MLSVSCEFVLSGCISIFCVEIDLFCCLQVCFDWLHYYLLGEGGNDHCIRYNLFKIQYMMNIVEWMT